MARYALATWYGNARPASTPGRLRCLASVLYVLREDAIHIGQDLVLFRRCHQRNPDPVAHNLCNFVAGEPQRLRDRDIVLVDVTAEIGAICLCLGAIVTDLAAFTSSDPHPERVPVLM